MESNLKPSLLKELESALQCLPGVGKKSAQRMAYHLLEHNRQGALNLSQILEQAMNQIGNCKQCRDYTEAEVCGLCSNEKRDKQTLCVVETPSDIAAIEGTSSYSGNYFVLMGNLSPLDGVGPEEIGLPALLSLVKQNNVKEIIIATSATVEGDTTAHFIKSMLTDTEDEAPAITRLAQGVPIGGELGYLDHSTLTLSLANRQGF